MDFKEYKTVGECLIQYREAQGLTTKELSDKIQITYVFLLAIEKEIIDLTKPMRQKIIKQLGFPLDAFDHIK